MGLEMGVAPDDLDNVAEHKDKGHAADEVADEGKSREGTCGDAAHGGHDVAVLVVSDHAAIAVPVNAAETRAMPMMPHMRAPASDRPAIEMMSNRTAGTTATVPRRPLTHSGVGCWWSIPAALAVARGKTSSSRMATKPVESAAATMPPIMSLTVEVSSFSVRSILRAPTWAPSARSGSCETWALTVPVMQAFLPRMSLSAQTSTSPSTVPSMVTVSPASAADLAEPRRATVSPAA